ncbi:MAG: prepilin-type N-terminal cleavage/methylation domain-containing protein [Bacilli bacterium]|nr:prepilin-type N-terminal cleavage/methylation domain-containing protein [Bacilli bacterium]
MKLNNKGFSLIELLAVLVILIAIMSIAMPSISSSLERNKDKQTKAKKALIESAAELYVTDHKNEVSNNDCITIDTLINEGYLEDDEIKGCVKYKIVDGEATYTLEQAS